MAEEWLRLNPAILARFHAFAPEIPPEELGRIITTIVALHDLGKLHRSFQSKSEEGWALGYGAAGEKRMEDNGRGFDHGLYTALILRDYTRTLLPEWREWRNLIDVAAAHHGTLYTRTTLNARGKYRQAVYEEDLIVRAVRLLSRLFGAPGVLPPPPKSGAFAMLLAGFCSVADWFGSNSKVFTFRPEVETEEALAIYLEELRGEGRAQQQLDDAGLLGKMAESPPGYSDLFSFVTSLDLLRPLQRAALDVPFGQEPGGEIVVVEAPMGSGKTELALYLAAQAIGNGHADGIYFALPTQASSNAIFDRIEDFAGKISAHEGVISFALAHGGKRFSEKYQELVRRYRELRTEFVASRQKGSGYGDRETGDPSEVVAPSWLNSSKRSLLASIGVGTIDQTMLGALSVRHSFVRLFALSGKVVIFDEIHAYDTYMNVIIRRLLEWLGALGVKVILLSATLPRRLRRELLESYGAASADDVPAYSNGYDPYPLMIHGTSSENIPHAPTPPEEPEKVVTVTMRSMPLDQRTLEGAQLAAKLAEGGGGCVAWIRNTVRETQEAWRLLREMGVPVVTLHARFARWDRNRIERELVAMLGKNAGKKGEPERPQRLVVVATQVIEQSVDLDFDVMLSDLAPVDLLLQRSGRLWRHERPIEVRYRHTRPELYILTPSPEELQELIFGSSAYVYDAETLLRTARLLEREDCWEMPAACRTLVAEVYDNEEYWTKERLDAEEKALLKARDKMHQVTATMEKTAQAVTVAKPEEGMLEGKEVPALSDDVDSNIVAATRYGGRSLTVVLIRQGKNGYYLHGTEEVSVTELPGEKKYGKILKLEEAVELASVSFLWYGKPPGESSLPEALRPFLKWWGERRRYDERIFLVLDRVGWFDHPDFSGQYSFDEQGNATEGLVIEPKKRDDDSDITYETL